MAELTVTQLLIGSAVAQGLGLISQGFAAKQQADFQAQIFERDAVLAKQAAEFEETRLREATRKLLGAQQAATGASGATTEGQFLLVQVETAEDAELDALAIRFSGSVAEVRARSSAALSRLQGRAARAAGFIGAGTSLLTGVTRASVFSETGKLVP